MNKGWLLSVVILFVTAACGELQDAPVEPAQHQEAQSVSLADEPCAADESALAPTLLCPPAYPRCTSKAECLISCGSFGAVDAVCATNGCCLCKY